MSQQAITEFWKRLSSDDTLRSEFDALVAANQNVPAAKVVELGARHGLEFTPDELHASVKLAAGAELSDEELSAVAGGLSLNYVKISYPTVESTSTDELSFKISSTSGFGIINF